MTTKDEKIEQIEGTVIESKKLTAKEIKDLMELNKETGGTNTLIKLMREDTKLLELISSASIKFATQVAGQRTLKSKDVEALNKLANTALKRQALIAAAIAEEKKPEEEKKGIEIKLVI